MNRTRLALLALGISCAPLSQADRARLYSEALFDDCQRAAMTPGELRRCFEDSRRYCIEHDLEPECGSTGFYIRAGAVKR